MAGLCVAAEDAGSDLTDAVAANCDSFTAGTKVLLASGAAIPISQLKPGDKVLATNTRTGKTSAQTVTAVIVSRDTDRYNLTIRTGHHDAIIHTTRNHLFWDLTRHQWVKAGALRHGDHLRTPSGATVTVAGGRTPPDAVGWMWDLSVPGGNDHDFYIDTSIATVLVHNCPVGQSFNEDQDALLKLAQRASRNPGGISEDEASTLNDWADEYGIRNHGPMTHTGNGYWDQILHIKIANIHIQVTP